MLRSKAERYYELLCDCHGEIIMLEDWESTDPFICVQMYYSSDYGLWGRIKAAIKYLRYGESAFNSMMVNKSELPSMLSFLQSVMEASQCPSE